MMIILHTVKYGDTSLIVHGYTENEGRCGFILRGAFKKAGKRNAPPATTVLHPLSIVNFESSKGNGKSDLLYLKEYSPKRHLHSIRSDFSKTSIAMFISEILYRTLLHAERDETLYAFLEDAILKLEENEGSTANFHIWFLDRYLSHLGFPLERGYADIFSPFSPTEAQILQQVHDSSYEEAMQIPMTGESRSKLLEEILKYLEFHSGTKLDIKSLQVFRSMSRNITQ